MDISRGSPHNAGMPMTDHSRVFSRAAGLAVLALVAAFVCAAPGDQWFVRQAAAQADVPVAAEFKLILKQWETSLSEIEQAVEAGPLSPAEIQRLRNRAETARDGARAAGAEAEKIGAEMKSLLEALGPKPKEGESAEALEVARRRAALEERLTAAEGRIKQAELVAARAEAAITGLAGARRAGLADRLGSKGPPVFAVATWEKAIPEFGGWLRKIADAPAVWWQSEQVQRIKGSGTYVVAALSILLVVVLGGAYRRWMLRRFGRDRSIETPDFPRRFVAAAAEGAARGLLPLLLTWTVYGGLHARGLLFGSFGDVIEGLAIAISAFAMIVGLSRSALAPRTPHWRIKDFGNRAARMLYHRIWILAALIAVQIFLSSPAKTLVPSADLIAAVGFVFRSATALVFLSLLDSRLWLSAADEKAHLHPRESSGEHSRHDGFHLHRYWWVRLFIGCIVITIPVSSLAGYHELSRFLTTRLVTVTALIALYLLVREFVRDMTDVFLDPERGFGKRTRAALNVGEQGAGMLRFWLVFGVDLVLLFGTGLLLLLLLGLDWREISDWVSQAMSGFAVGGRTISPRNILVALAVFVVFYILVRLLQRFLDHKVLPNTRLDIGVRTAVRAGVGYLGITVAALIAITAAGFDLSNLAIIAGALSVGIGFGLQAIVNNFVSGIILLVERPIKVGDWVIAGGNEGIVKRISVRSTEIETFNLASVIVPNSELIANTVTNWTHKDLRARVEVPVGVSYASDPDQVHEILLSLASDHAQVLKFPEPFVIFKGFGDSSLNFELRCYVGRATDMITVASDLRYAIVHAFRAGEIEIPFPQQDLHLRDLDRLETAFGNRAAKPDSALAPAPASKPRRKSKGRNETDIDTDSGDGDD